MAARFCTTNRDTACGGEEAAKKLSAVCAGQDTSCPYRKPTTHGERMHTTLKTINAAEGRVGGYLVVWGSPQQRDLQGEYFTPKTDLGLGWYDQRPVLYHH